ncbi:MAG: hypothetical protein II504_08195 [Clostridia bacterium]|nr:hypothetical protein [Clostridia bacterium]
MQSIPVRFSVCLLMLLLLLSFTLSPAAPVLAEAPTDAPASGSVSQEEEPAPQESAAPAKGYILLTYSGGSFWLPLPESEDYTLPVQQVRDDGTEEVNLIHVTPDGFYMESSTCENQDCVDQGMVTLENRDSRILYNAVLCLPNMVSLALYTPEEILEMYASAPAPADDAETADENNQ